MEPALALGMKGLPVNGLQCGFPAQIQMGHTRQPCGSDAGDRGALWLFHRWVTDQHLVLIDPRAAILPPVSEHRVQQIRGLPKGETVSAISNPETLRCPVNAKSGSTRRSVDSLGPGAPCPFAALAWALPFTGHPAMPSAHRLLYLAAKRP